MSVPRTVAAVLRDHVTLTVEGIDRMYLNVYVPQLQRELGVVGGISSSGKAGILGRTEEPRRARRRHSFPRRLP